METRSGTGRVATYQFSDTKTSEVSNKGERRKQIRYRVKDLILVKLRSETEREVGQLLDISAGGLSLYYFVDNKPGSYTELQICPSSDEFTIEKIPFRKISDTELNYQSLFSIKILRRQGLQFRKLTPEQKVKLDYFLRYYTVETLA